MDILSGIVQDKILGRLNLRNGVTIGRGGKFSTIDDALVAMGSRLTQVYQITDTIIASVGSPNIALSSSLLPMTKTHIDTLGTSHPWAGFDYVQISGDSRLFKVKQVLAQNQFHLAEDYDTAIFASRTLTFYKLDWRTLMLLPGEHTTPSLDAFDIVHGIHLIGMDKHRCIVSENGATPSGPIYTLGESVYSNLTFGPTETWSALDGLGGQNTLGAANPGGMRIDFDNVIVRCLNSGGHHGGGWTNLPYAGGGRTKYRNCTFEFDSMLRFAPGGRVTPAVADTQINLIGCDFEYRYSKDVYTGVPSVGLAPGIYVDADYELSLSNCDFDMDHGPVIPAPGAGVFSMVNLAAAAIAPTVNIRKTTCRISNSNGAYGVYVPAGVGAAVINIDQSDIEAGGSTGTRTGVYTNDADATVNIRNSRIKGATNSINAALGTINYDGSTTLIGTATGGTASDT